MSGSAWAEPRRHWPVILACFWLAVFAWGFGFYGHAIYLAELRARFGWPTGVISAATTTMYLGGALTMPWVHPAMRRFGPGRVLMAGACLLGVGAIGFATATAPWQLFLSALPMAVGWACATGTAIATALAVWFDRGRPLALSLALNGASASGFLVAPLLVWMTGWLGLDRAVPWLVGLCWLVLLPLLALCLRRTLVVAATATEATGGVPDGRAGFATRRDALRARRVWGVMLPFALALAAQVGFIVHMVAFLMPALGPAGTSQAVALASVAAMLGRIGAGLVIDRLPQRGFSALSFLVQALGLLLLFLWPAGGWTLYLGSVLFGLSVGNVITLPAIVLQREFASRSFGLLVGLNGAIGQFTLSIAPVLFGLMRDLAGHYGPVLILCITLQVLAAWLIRRPVA